MKKTSIAFSKHIPSEFKRIDTSSVPESITITSEEEKRLKKIKKPLTSSQKQKVIELAKPKDKQQDIFNMNQWRIKKSSLKYKATKRIRKLAEPKYVVPKVVNRVLPESASYASQVSRKALRYIPTNRIMELALPKGFEFVSERDRFE